MTASFLRAALAWEGTPWAPSGAVKGCRSNCVGFLVDALESAGYHALAERAKPGAAFDAPPYTSALSRWCDDHLLIVSRSRAEAGDLLLFRFKGVPCHMALLTEPGVVLDCNAAYGKVCRHGIPASWQLRRVYRLP